MYHPVSGLKRYPDWAIPIFIFGVSLYASLLYSLRHFTITADSGREYDTYIKFVQQVYWSPFVDDMLSSSLFTTYIPASIQHLLNLQNQEMVYRIWLALVCSPLPMMVYLLARKFTSTGVSIGVAIIVYTSFYYQGFASYARMLVAMTMACCLVLSILNKGRWKYLFIFLSVMGVLIGHYSVAYIYEGMLVGASMVSVIYYLIVKKLPEHMAGLLVSALLLSLGTYLYYGDGMIGAVGDYAASAGGSVIKELSEVAASLPHEATQNVSVAWSIPIDILLARLLLIGRSIVALVVWVSLWRKDRAWSLIGILYGGVICVALLSVSLRSVEVALGSLRPSFVVLPLELLGIAYWWGKRGDDWRIYPLLAIGAVVYH